MTPDMKRLIKVAHEAAEGELETSRIELVIRAVLTELRKPSKETLAAGAAAIDDEECILADSYGGKDLSSGYDYALAGHVAMIDAILAEPATT